VSLPSPLRLSRMDEPFWFDRPIRWADYHVRKRALCEDCVLALHEQKGSGPAPRQAMRKRTSGGGKRARVAFLCQQHAQLWQDEQQRRERR
jgi:hypothetical protein